MPKITPDNKGPAVRIVVWLLVVFSVTACVIRFTAKAHRMRIGLKHWTLDDWMITSALTLSILQSVLVDISVTDGFGERRLSRHQLVGVEKAVYASHFFYVGSICTAKMSAVALLRSVTPNSIHRKAGLGIGVFILLWSAASIFVVAFQCSPPRSWDLVNNKCINTVAWWDFYEAVNMLTDIVLMVLPIWIIFSTQAGLLKKLNLSIPFLMRTLAIAACACKIYYFTSIWHERGPNFFFELWKLIICNEAIQCLEILPVCFIYIKQFLDSLDAGFMAADDLARRGETDMLGLGNSGYSSKNALQTSRDREAYIRLQGEGKNSRAPSEGARDVERQVFPQSSAAAFRGKTLDVNQDRREAGEGEIRIAREVTIEEAPWKGKGTAV